MLGFVDATSPSYLVMPAVRVSGHDNLSPIAVSMLPNAVSKTTGMSGRCSPWI